MRKNIIWLLLLGLGLSLGVAQNAPQEWYKSHLLRGYRLHKSLAAPGNFCPIDVTFYDLDLSLDFAAHAISGKVSVEFINLMTGRDTLWFDMCSQLKADSVSANVKAFYQSKEQLYLILKRPLSAAEHSRVTVWYHGTVTPDMAPAIVFDRFNDTQEPMAWTLSEPYGARCWWPCKDTPADKADSVNIALTVPQPYVAASNGTLRKVVAHDDSTVTYHWQERYPITTYLVSLVAGPYAHYQEYWRYSPHDSLLLDYYVSPAKLSRAKEAFKEMGSYLTALSTFFGPYPFLKEKYGQAEFNWRGAMEHQTLTSVGRVADWWRFVYVHELAHQWFGDAVTCASWQDIWLNEGFATYSEALYAQWAGYKEYPPGQEALQAYMQTKWYDGDKTVFVSDTSEFFNIFDVVVYHKGAWILHMLRHIVGDTAFFDILRSYVQNPVLRYGSVSTADFIQVAQNISGLELQDFFHQWLFYPGKPHYGYQWRVEDMVNNRWLVRLDVKQLQEQGLYNMPLDVAFYFQNGTDTLLTVQNRQKAQSYFFHFQHYPVSVKLDPQQWLLADFSEQVRGASRQNPFFKRVFPNPFHAKTTFLVSKDHQQTLEILIYDLLGHVVARLKPIQQSFSLDVFEWQGVDRQGRKAASGLYLAVLVKKQGAKEQWLDKTKVVLLK